jgi:hypothetical protein
MASFEVSRTRALYKAEAIVKAYTHAALGAHDGQICSADLFDHTSLLRPLRAFGDVTYDANTGATHATWRPGDGSLLGTYLGADRYYKAASERVRSVLAVAHGMMGTPPTGPRHAKTASLIDAIYTFVSALEYDQSASITLLKGDADSFERERTASGLGQFFDYNPVTGNLVFALHADPDRSYTEGERALQSAVNALSDARKHAHVCHGQRKAFGIIVAVLSECKNPRARHHVREYLLETFTAYPNREKFMKEFLEGYSIDGFSFGVAFKINEGDEYDHGYYRVEVEVDWKSPV